MECNFTPAIPKTGTYVSRSAKKYKEWRNSCGMVAGHGEWAPVCCDMFRGHRKVHFIQRVGFKEQSNNNDIV